LKTGVSGLVMAIHPFGNYLDKFHPHLHGIVTDGLYSKNELFLLSIFLSQRNISLIKWKSHF